MENNMAARWILLVPALAMSLIPRVFWAQSCVGLQDEGSPTVAITAAKVVPAGAFKEAGSLPESTNLPSFCRVTARLKPTSDSDIGIEVWLPISNWNGKFLAVGSGGWGGSIAYGE